MFFADWGILYAVLIPVVYTYRHRKGKCMKSPDSETAVVAAMVWPVTLMVDYVYGER